MATAFSSLPAVLNPPLPDREAVIDALYRACLAWDTNDQSLCDTAFTTDAVLSLNGQVMTGRDQIAKDGNALIFTLDTTHLVGNTRVTFTTPSGGDGEQQSASITATVMAQHFVGSKGFDLAPESANIPYLMNHNKHLMSGTLYSGDLIKDSTDGLWKFKLLKIKPNWIEGHFSVVGGGPFASGER
ncbi:uncharacterized protein B0I36DRAFT_331096 [Microdochium trichocladiopsis]|uniref:SnoaL-like domain-containing protein n=1 Tax=Microdochium trichocladiopsis TaxID=1682393 RepID=A0A9P8Y0V8_9PEZI|nr:uncharacterized protein B0I36DRAFT_331096 [Microdochium trichocladiopsis]KAH7026658.1 hypothetical protein B0I36DRAFT_331096 [Microdochium trichocladiopsis]